MPFNLEQFKEWSRQSEDNQEIDNLYSGIRQEIQDMFASEDTDEFNPEMQRVKASIEANAEYFLNLSLTQDQALSAFARGTLAKTRLMLSIMHECMNNYVGADTHGFFNQRKLPLEMAKGGHIYIRGGAALFDQIRELEISHARFSSHYLAYKIQEYRGFGMTQEEAERRVQNDKPDCSIQAPGIFNEVVFGKVGNDSWFQFEAHGHQSRTYASRCLRLINTVLELFRYSVEKLLHHVDYLKYVAAGRASNIGPYGNSPYVEADPIYLTPVMT